MSGPEPLTYAAGRRLARRGRRHRRPRAQRRSRSTRTPRVLGDLGGFAGLVSAGGYRDPVLVAGTDGVGTKLLLQREAGRAARFRHRSAWRCASTTCSRPAREPLLFLDYIAVGRLDPERVADVVEGVADGCRQAGCALLGGETAELPDMYGADDLDLAGFASASSSATARRRRARRSRATHWSAWRRAASHSNGFTLVRRLLERAGSTPGDAPGDLLAPTRIYAPAVAALRAASTCARWRTSPAAASRATCRACCRRASARASTRALAGARRSSRGSRGWASSATRCAASSTAASATWRSSRPATSRRGARGLRGGRLRGDARRRGRRRRGRRLRLTPCGSACWSRARARTCGR